MVGVGDGLQMKFLLTKNAHKSPHAQFNTGLVYENFAMGLVGFFYPYFLQTPLFSLGLGCGLPPAFHRHHHLLPATAEAAADQAATTAKEDKPYLT